MTKLEELYTAWVASYDAVAVATDALSAAIAANDAAFEEYTAEVNKQEKGTDNG